MKKKLTVKEILNCKGKKKLTEVYVHNTIEAEACETAGIDMIISSENNNFKFLRESILNVITLRNNIANRVFSNTTNK